MGELVSCPSCELLHERRPHEPCPRCGLRLGAEARPRGTAASSKGSRTAGFLLLGSCLATALALFFGDGSLRPLPGVALADLVLGAGLAAGRAAFRPWARVRAGAGLLVAAPLLWYVAGPPAGLLHAVFGAALLLLLAADRLPGSLAVGLTVGSLTLVGLAAGPGRLPALGGLERDEATAELRGAHGAFRLQLRGRGWQVLGQAEARKHNALVEAWARRDDGSHVFVLSEPVAPGAVVDLDRAVDAAALRAGIWIPRLHVVARSQPRSRRPARLVQTVGSIDGVRVDAWHGVVIDGGRLYQVHAVSPRRLFPAAP